MSCVARVIALMPSISPGSSDIGRAGGAPQRRRVPHIKRNVSISLQRLVGHTAKLLDIARLHGVWGQIHASALWHGRLAAEQHVAIRRQPPFDIIAMAERATSITPAAPRISEELIGAGA
jgi:hypothetical protein